MTTPPGCPSCGPGPAHGVLAGALIKVIGWYRVYISPARPPVCRFSPSCSEYAVHALSERGLAMGLGLAVWRLLRCGPWSSGGWDPVPKRPEAPPAPGAKFSHRKRVYEGAPR